METFMSIGKIMRQRIEYADGIMTDFMLRDGIIEGIMVKPYYYSSKYAEGVEIALDQQQDTRFQRFTFINGCVEQQDVDREYLKVANAYGSYLVSDDAIAQRGDNVKIVCNAGIIKRFNAYSKLVTNDVPCSEFQFRARDKPIVEQALALSEEEYETLHGTEFNRKDLDLAGINRPLTKEEVSKHPVWQLLASNTENLDQYTDIIFNKFRSRYKQEGYDYQSPINNKQMGVNISIALPSPRIQPLMISSIYSVRATGFSSILPVIRVSFSEYNKPIPYEHINYRDRPQKRFRELRELVEPPLESILNILSPIIKKYPQTTKPHLPLDSKIYYGNYLGRSLIIIGLEKDKDKRRNLEREIFSLYLRSSHT